MTFKTIYSVDIYPVLSEFLRELPRVKEKKPIHTIYFSPKSAAAKESAELVKERISIEFEVENFVITNINTLPKFAQIKVLPNEKEIRKKFKKKSDAVLEVIKMLDPISLMEEITAGPVTIPLGKEQEATIDQEDIKFEIDIPENVVYNENEHGFVFVDLSVDDRLRQKIILIDAIDAINKTKRKVGISDETPIKLYLNCKDEECETIIKPIRLELKNKTNAMELWIITKNKKHDWNSHKYYGTIKIGEKNIDFAIDLVEYL